MASSRARPRAAMPSSRWWSGGRVRLGQAGATRAGLLCLCVLALGCQPPPPLPQKDIAATPIRDGLYVHADDQSFTVGGQPFRFVGANAAMMHGERVRENMERLLDALVDDGIRVARVWAMGEHPEDDGKAWRQDYNFRVGPDGWVQASFEHLDRLLVEARRRDIRVIVVLANRWSDYGGLGAYAGWAGIEPRRRSLLHAELGVVLRDPRARQLYRAHVERVVGRTNTLTGAPYRDDPTIFSWELINELTSGTCATNDAVSDWVAEMSRVVRALDQNHMIAAGHMGYKTALSREGWIAAHAHDEIDYVDHHSYPQHVLGIETIEDLRAYVADRGHLAFNVLHKPLVIGEIGFPRGDAAYADRAAWFGGFMQLASEAGAAGVLPWIYRSDDGSDDRQGIYVSGDRADEVTMVRATFKWWASPWAGQRATATAPEILTAGADEALVSLALRGVAPYPEGEWTEADPSTRRLQLDPWALAEGCARAGEPAFASYVVAPPVRRAPASMRLAPIAGAEGASLRLSVDGAPLATFDAGEGWRSDDAGKLADVFTDESVWWLRFEAENDAARALLRRFTASLPADERWVSEWRWEAQP